MYAYMFYVSDEKYEGEKKYCGDLIQEQYL